MATTELEAINLEAKVARVAAGSFRRIRAIALNTFRESVRDRVLYNLILFVLILVGASVFVSNLSMYQESKFIVDLGLSSMLVFGSIIAIFIGVGLVYKEIDKRTIYNLLSKPVHRYEFIIGKYLGLCLTLFVNSAIMVVGTTLALMYVNGGFVSLQVSLLPAAYLILLELTLLVAVALMFSSFSTPMLSALFSFAVYVIGHFSADLKLAAQLSGSVIAKSILMLLYYLLPNLSNFGFIGPASHGRVVPLDMALTSTVYWLIYVALLISAAILIFQNRNFK